MLQASVYLLKVSIALNYPPKECKLFWSIHEGGSYAEYLVSSRRPTFLEGPVLSRSPYLTSVNWPVRLRSQSKLQILCSARMYVRALACSYTQLALSIQLNSISATAYVQRSAIEYIHQLHTFNAAQLSTFINRVHSAQRNWIHSSHRNWVHSTDSIVLKIWTALHLPSPIKFRHWKRVAIENLLFGKLLVFSPQLSSSKLSKL